MDCLSTYRYVTYDENMDCQIAKLTSAVVLWPLLMMLLAISATIAAGEDDAIQRDVRSSSTTLYYSIDEQLPVGSVVADVSCRNSNLSATSRGKTSRDDDCTSNQSRYVILNRRPRTSNMFSLNVTSGVVTTSGPVDRELICSLRAVVCSVTLDVAVQTVDAFDMVRVEVS